MTALPAPALPPEGGDSQKRQQILNGARRCFLERGFDATSMNDIVASAGVSKATLYAYFPSKEKLFADMVFEDRRKFSESNFSLGDEARPLRDILTDLGHQLVVLPEHPDLLNYFRMTIAAAARFPEIGRAFYEGGPHYTIRRVARLFAARMESGELKKADPELTAMQFIELVHAGNMKPCFFGMPTVAQRLGRDAVVKAAVDLFLGGMAAQAIH
ncbi:MAG: TetR/AcrR family transcriptional regulator [Proteobacteria bacterium]|nr:TetR/AcrR family transcriptional regulator [Pseudomonadota bacterium]